MKRSTIAKTFTIAAVAALALGVAPTAKAQDKACSKATLKGTYTHIATGFFTSPGSMATPFAACGEPLGCGCSFHSQAAGITSWRGDGPPGTTGPYRFHGKSP